MRTVEETPIFEAGAGRYGDCQKDAVEIVPAPARGTAERKYETDIAGLDKTVSTSLP
jgi:hypothetical protein